MNQDKKIGVSIMKIEEKLDSGPVLASKELALDQNATYGEIQKKLSLIGSDLLIESLKNIENGKAKFINQAHSDSTYAKKIDKNETKINWSLDANKVIAHIHGLSPNPGAWITTCCRFICSQNFKSFGFMLKPSTRIWAQTVNMCYYFIGI
jgi:methionyl-tRNA formyltransferase